MALMGSVPLGWLTALTVQLTFPLSSDVALQDCSLVPEPIEMVTTLVGNGVPALGVSVVRLAVKVTGWPFTPAVGPV